MTCIVGIKDENKIIIGVDSNAGSSDFAQELRSDRKMFRRARAAEYSIIVAYTGSYRLGQALEHHMPLPPAPDRMAERVQPAEVSRKWVIGRLVETMRQTLKQHGAVQTSDGVDTMIEGGNLLIGIRFTGGTYYLCETFSDFSVAENMTGRYALGSGWEVAMGAMYAMAEFEPRTLEARVRCALRAAEHYNAGVRGPFHFEELPT